MGDDAQAYIKPLLAILDSCEDEMQHLGITLTGMSARVCHATALTKLAKARELIAKGNFLRGVAHDDQRTLSLKPGRIRMEATVMCFDCNITIATNTPVVSALIYAGWQDTNRLWFCPECWMKRSAPAYEGGADQ